MTAVTRNNTAVSTVSPNQTLTWNVEITLALHLPSVPTQEQSDLFVYAVPKADGIVRFWGIATDKRSSETVRLEFNRQKSILIDDSALGMILHYSTQQRQVVLASIPLPSRAAPADSPETFAMTFRIVGTTPYISVVVDFPSPWAFDGLYNIPAAMYCQPNANIYEAGHRENSAPPRSGGIQSLLFFHDCGSYYGGTTILTTTDTSSQFYSFDRLGSNEEVSQANIQSGSFSRGAPATSQLHYDADTFNSLLANNQVRIGASSDLSQRIRLHLVTPENYMDSIRTIEGYLMDFFGRSLSRALFRRFIHGDFTPDDSDFRPATTPTDVAVAANGYRPGKANDYRRWDEYPGQLSHNFGAMAFDTDAMTATVPLFSYAASSPASRSVAAQHSYAKGIKDYLIRTMTFDEAHRIYTESCHTSEPCVAPLSAAVEFDGSWPFEIRETGLGHYHGTGSIVMGIVRNSATRYTIDVRYVNMVVQDLFDFDYFSGGGFARWAGYNQAGASVQSGYARCGNPPGVGEAFVVRYDTQRANLGRVVAEKRSSSVTVPNVRGLFWVVAEGAIEDSGLNVGDIVLERSPSPPWTVVRQEPDPGTIMAGNGLVRLMVSSGLDSGIPGDVDGNGAIECGDLVMLRRAFGNTYLEKDYDGRADINGDGRVDIRDLAYLAQVLRAGVLCP